MIVLGERTSHANLPVSVRPLRSAKGGEVVYQQEYVKSTSVESAMEFFPPCVCSLCNHESNTSTKHSRTSRFSVQYQVCVNRLGSVLPASPYLHVVVRYLCLISPKAAFHKGRVLSESAAKEHTTVSVFRRRWNLQSSMRMIRRMVIIMMVFSESAAMEHGVEHDDDEDGDDVFRVGGQGTCSRVFFCPCKAIRSTIYVTYMCNSAI
jgi:hypothetical protein